MAPKIEEESEKALAPGEAAEQEAGAAGRLDKPYVVQLKDPERKEAADLARENLFSLHFKEISLDSVISMLSDRGRNFRYVIHPDVGERKVLGLVLENVTWRDALDIVTKLHGLAVTEEHALIIINTQENMAKTLEADAERLKKSEEMAKMERSRLSESTRSKQLVEGEKRTFQTFKLKYAEPNEVKVYLEKVFNGIESAQATPAEGGEQAAGGAASSGGGSQRAGEGQISFSIFSKASIITAYGTPTQLDEVGRRLTEIDVPQQQIFIEARIVEVYRNYSRSIGVEWGGAGTKVSNGFPAVATVAGGANVAAVTTVGNAGYSAGTSTPAVSFPASDPTGGVTVPAGLSLALSDVAGTLKINMRLSALEQDGKSKTLSNPKLTTVNGVKAKIESGREIPYQQSSGSSGGTTVAFKNAVIALEVTPFVTPDNMINMKITAKKDDADFTNQVLGVPSILTRTINTNVLVTDGGTAVLGGVFENEKVDTEKGVPWMASIPIIGWLFKSSDTRDNEKELLIFITPRIVKGNFS
ncbi:MAG: type IV pilus secretin PilQ [Nitrospinae bacterium]|nr:type IV pilus secretin PilQ [Nitrospinota bacterium]